MPSPVVASAPGKVLLAGGYLVLDRQYCGLVFGLDARIHVHIQSQANTESSRQKPRILVKSPQFIEAEWLYVIQSTDHGGGAKAIQQSDPVATSPNRNPFVETTLGFALSYVASFGISNFKSANITILADDDYYSSTSKTSESMERQHDRFADFGVRLEDAHKTGLGSSAALVTALTAALVSFYLSSYSTDSSEMEKLSRIHNLAQAAHCAAQGKVGSGFDVAAAVYGSCVYRRFSPSVLEKLGSPGEVGFQSRIKVIVEDTDEERKWDTEVLKEAVGMPKGLRLIMCDVDCGSQTVGMVKKVLSWRKQNPEQAKELWNQLHGNNMNLGRLLKSDEIQQQKLKDALLLIRSRVQEMSRLSDVPIEPTSQQQLIDACSKVEGVVGGVVPGAGGYDAIALLVLDETAIIENLNQLLTKWTVVQDGREGQGSVRMLGVRQEQEGIRCESPEAYSSWIRQQYSTLSLHTIPRNITSGSLG